MRKFILILLLAASAWAQSPVLSKTETFIAVAAGTTIPNIGGRALYYRLYWYPIGAPASCTVAVDSSTDGSSWSAGNVIAGQTCTTPGSVTLSTAAVYNYVRMNVTALTALKSVTVTLVAYESQPSGVGPVLNASLFPGSTSTAKIDSAVASCGTGPCVIVAPPGMATGQPTTIPNAVLFVDLRQTSDLINTTTTDPDRTAHVFYDNNLGEFTTLPLQGTVTLTNGSTAVSGAGTNFLTSLDPSVHLGRSIKMTADGTTCWAAIGSVASNVAATLTGNYACAGGSGSASYFITQLGFVIRNTVSNGTPNTLSGGESVGLTIAARRTGGTRGLYGENINITYDTAASTAQGQAVGLQIDLSNNAADDATNVDTFGLDILSAGSKHPNAAILINSTTSANSWRRGIFITPMYSEAGLKIQGGGDHIQLLPSALDTNPQIGGRIVDDSAYRWLITNLGLATFASALLGDWAVSPGYGFFQNSALAVAAGNYALVQGAPGDTHVNAPTGQLLTLNINNTPIATISSASLSSTAYATSTNCADSAGAAACGAAPAGAFVIDATATSTVVSTTAVTADSQIFLQEDSSLGTRLSVTCNTQSVLVLGSPVVTARTAGTSFTATIVLGPTTNPMCVNYFIVN